MAKYPTLAEYLARSKKAAKTAEDRKRVLTLCYAPKFFIEDSDVLPPIDQANKALTPPAPFPITLIACNVALENEANPTDERIHTLCIIELFQSEQAVLFNAFLLSHTEPVYGISGQFTQGKLLSESKFAHVITPKIESAAIGDELYNLTIRFLALTAAENVEIVSPDPQSLKRKRELARIKANKHINTYTLYHLHIPHKRVKYDKLPPTGRHNRAHWRRAHLRHYTAGVGHIKVTKTVAIPPVYCSGEGFANKDYIL